VNELGKANQASQINKREDQDKIIKMQQKFTKSEIREQISSIIII
jgi:hypothetical protein